MKNNESLEQENLEKILKEEQKQSSQQKNENNREFNLSQTTIEKERQNSLKLIEELGNKQIKTANNTSLSERKDGQEEMPTSDRSQRRQVFSMQKGTFREVYPEQSSQQNTPNTNQIDNFKPFQSRNNHITKANILDQIIIKQKMNKSNFNNVKMEHFYLNCFRKSKIRNCSTLDKQDADLVPTFCQRAYGISILNQKQAFPQQNELYNRNFEGIKMQAQDTKIEKFKKLKERANQKELIKNLMFRSYKDKNARDKINAHSKNIQEEERKQNLDIKQKQFQSIKQQEASWADTDNIKDHSLSRYLSRGSKKLGKLADAISQLSNNEDLEGFVSDDNPQNRKVARTQNILSKQNSHHEQIKEL